MNDLVIYGLAFGYNQYFYKGSAIVVGRFNGEPFSCISKSGSQNLWLPFRPTSGLKLFHPKGPSGTADRAKKHFEAQALLADRNLAPKPFELLNISTKFEKASEEIPLWNAYGIMMERVFSGGYSQISTNLGKFGCNFHQMHGLYDILKPYGAEALNLREYAILCMLFDGDIAKIQEMIDRLEKKLPTNFDKGPDLLTPTNVVLDHFGNCKVVDFDLCNA